MTHIWIVGKVVGVAPQGPVWELQGLYWTRKLAIAACKDGRYFIGLVEIGTQAPDEPTKLPCFEVPMQGAA